MTIQMGLDGALLLFFVGGLIYCLRLGVRLRKPYAHQEELKQLVSTYTQLNETSQKTLIELKETLEKSSTLKTDLAYFTDRGESLMKELEPRIQELRTSQKRMQDKESTEKVFTQNARPSLLRMKQVNE
ncbi:MAG: hypothetical protein V6Z78_00645 [Holosporaceae bacterium]